MRHDSVRHSRSAGRPAAPARLAGMALVLALAAASGAATAQAPERLYQVEVVVFAQPAGRSVELPPRRPVPLDDRGAEQEAGMGTPDGVDPGPAGLPGEDEGFLLPDGFAPARQPRALDAVARRLNTGEYRLLWHQAWVQPPQEGAGEALTLLAGLGQGPADPELAGRISLSLGRFLHLGMDLELGSGTGAEAQLRQRRRIRLGQDQYYDHPRIGVIAVVHPVEVTQPSP